jgi:hypothetical protein
VRFPPATRRPGQTITSRPKGVRVRIPSRAHTAIRREVTSLLPPGPNGELAEGTRQPLQRAGIDLPEPIASSTDHLSVLRYAATRSPATLEAVERAAVAGEIAAARLGQTNSWRR